MLPNIHMHDEVVRALRMLHHAGFTNAIIAGGSVRDIYFGNIARNVDIIVQDPKHSREPVQRGLLEITEPDFDQDQIWNMMQMNKPPGGKSRTYGDNTITRSEMPTSSHMGVVYRVMKNFMPYDLIFVEHDPIKFVNEYFDFGICKCYCDGRRIRFTHDFLQDARDKTITLVGRHLTEYQYIDATQNHLSRIADKFPGYAFKVAPWNQSVVARFKKK